MCGVIGVISKQEQVISDVIFGLTSLQQRGQDGCGILTVHKKGYVLKKEEGLVKDVFKDEDLGIYEGTIGLGHTRYTTAGSHTGDNTHPYIVSATHKIAMAHNGNLTNYFELIEVLKKKGVFLETATDLEPMVRIFAYEFEVSNDLLYAARRLMNHIKGSYSIVGIMENHGLFAMRDPKGIKPLMLGKKGNKYCIVSESVPLQQLGYELVRDIEPGEFLLIDQKGNMISHIVKQEQHTPCMFEWVYFARPDSILDKRSVYNARRRLGSAIAQRWKIKADVVIPVPDTARTAAIQFAETLGLKYKEGLIKNRYIGRTFIMPTQASREKEVNIKLNPIISAIKNKRVVLFDDSIVRGTTSKRIVTLMREAGAKEIHFISTCPPIKFPCYYGIDMSTKDELIANGKTIEEIREYIGADTLTYATVDDIKSALKKESFCAACLTGEYPYPVSRKEKDVLSNARKECY